jgi:hypothetical protein
LTAVAIKVVVALLAFSGMTTTIHIPDALLAAIPEPPLSDGLGHYWKWGAWRNADDSLWQPPAPARERAPGGCPVIIFEALGGAGCAISWCESNWNPNATGAEGERGYFQVHPRWHADATYDPAGNVASAVRISRGGADWSQWTTRSVLWTGVCP